MQQTLQYNTIKRQTLHKCDKHYKATNDVSDNVAYIVNKATHPISNNVVYKVLKDCSVVAYRVGLLTIGFSLEVVRLPFRVCCLEGISPYKACLLIGFVAYRVFPCVAFRTCP